MGDFYNQVTHFIPDFACKVTHFYPNNKSYRMYFLSIIVKKHKNQCHWRGKVREMTHGVFYIINDRRCITKYQIMCHLYTTKACRNNNTTGFINKTITIVTSSIPRESLA